jgi:hypothetical protein
MGQRLRRKGKILDYNVKRATNNSNSNSKFRNNDKRYAKQHEQDAESPPNGGLEAKVHDVHIFDKPVALSNNDYDLLNLAPPTPASSTKSS